ncbi:hypothetical protein ACLB2K_030990 [Fragaria x ananassa]
MATYRALLSLKSSLDDPDSRLSALSALRLLNLSNNVFNRTFPPELSNLTNLRVLDLYNNNLTGVLPVSVAHMTNLRHLHLGGNFSLWRRIKGRAPGGTVPAGMGEGWLLLLPEPTLWHIDSIKALAIVAQSFLFLMITISCT